jgi:hypothetical protein
MQPAGSGADADALCAPVERLLRPDGSGAQAQVQSMLALLRSGRLEDALKGCEQLSEFACESRRLEPACDGREVAGAAGALAAVVGATRTHPQLQLVCCATLFDLCEHHARNCTRAGAAGAIDAVLTAAEVVAERSADLEPLPLVALHFLTVSDAANATAAVAAGALEHIIGQMRARPAAAAVQNIGCCLTTLAKLDAAAAARAIEAGAIDVCLACMGAHPSHVQLCGNGCGALQVLYEREHVIESSAHARALAAAAVAAVLRALDAHRGNADVQTTGVRVLRIIAGTSCVHQTAVGAAAAVPSCVAALRAHPGSARVQQSGISALGVLCANADGKANATAAATAGTLQLVLAAMDAHEDEDLQADGCYTIATLCDSGVAVAVAQHARAAVTVVRAMRAYGASARNVQRNGCVALVAIAAASAASLASARAAGAVEAVVGTLHAIQRGAFVDLDALCRVCVSALKILVAASAAGDVRAAAAQDAAVRAGALERTGDVPSSAHVSGLLAHVDAALADAARRHDAAPCAHAAACARCAAFRARGKMCALPSCSARRRSDAGDAKKKLLRCARCEKAMYCCKAHQTADWAPRHQAECRRPQARGGGASGSAET